MQQGIGFDWLWQIALRGKILKPMASGWLRLLQIKVDSLTYERVAAGTCPGVVNFTSSLKKKLQKIVTFDIQVNLIPVITETD